MDTKQKRMNAAILFFCATAIFMLGVLAGTTNDEPAVAATAQSVGNGYVLTSAQASRTQDIVYVIDTASDRMVAYTVQRRGNDYRIRLVSGVDLGRLIQSVSERQTEE